MSAGPVSKIRLLGDYHHPTRIAFVEFTNAESARAALNCSGAMLGNTRGLWHMLFDLLAGLSSSSAKHARMTCYGL